MRIRLLTIAAILTVSLYEPNAAAAQQPAKDSRSFSVQCRLMRQYEHVGANGRAALENSTTTLPPIVTLENTRAEYITERKSDSGVYQFRVSVLIQKISEGRVRLELQLEDTWSDGPLDKPIVHRHALMTTRQTALGSKLKIALQEKNDKDESISVELSIKELMEDE